MEYNKMGLVLEGGGLRGAFTAGVLDAFMEKNIYFPYTIGVSAGANNGMSYVAKQPGRSFFCNIELMKAYNYIGLKHFIKGNGYINLRFLIKDYPEKHVPLDFETYRKSGRRFVMVTSNCLTGKAVYCEEYNSKGRLLDLCQASCSIPFLCPIKEVGGIPMLDGGVCDSVPVIHAEKDGYIRNVIILTQCKGYRKPDKRFSLPQFAFRKYPQLRKKLILRYKIYNDVLDYVDELENKGNAYVIRPSNPVKVSWTTTDYNLLKELYDDGKTVGTDFVQALCNVSP